MNQELENFRPIVGDSEKSFICPLTRDDFTKEHMLRVASEELSNVFHLVFCEIREIAYSYSNNKNDLQKRLKRIGAIADAFHNANCDYPTAIIDSELNHILGR